MSGSNERVAVVAGAGGELGRVTAEKLAAAGFTVAGVDRSEEGLKELPDSIWREAEHPGPHGDRRRVLQDGTAGRRWLASVPAAPTTPSSVSVIAPRPSGAPTACGYCRRAARGSPAVTS